MKIAKHTVPSVTYNLKVEGELMDQANEENPLTFIAGIGMMIPGFEEKLEDLQAGDAFDFEVQPENGYGEYNEQAVVELPIDTFKVDGEINREMLVVGKEIPMQDQNGNPLRGRIEKVGLDKVTMDFNHVLSGKVLHFTGQVVSVRMAEKEELDHGHVHGPEGHQH